MSLSFTSCEIVNKLPLSLRDYMIYITVPPWGLGGGVSSPLQESGTPLSLLCISGDCSAVRQLASSLMGSARFERKTRCGFSGSGQVSSWSWLMLYQLAADSGSSQPPNPALPMRDETQLCLHSRSCLWLSQRERVGESPPPLSQAQEHRGRPSVFSCCCDKILMKYFDEGSLREEGFLWVPRLWSASGGDGERSWRQLVILHPQSGSRERGMLVLSSPAFLLSIQHKTSVHETMPHIFRVGLPYSVNPFRNTLIHMPRGVFPQ